jgi:uncharacterized delta-60 repeat protein
MVNYLKQVFLGLFCVAIVTACGSGLCPLKNSTGLCVASGSGGWSSPIGVLDTSFGSGAGYVQTAVGGFSDEIKSVVIQSDGKIVAGGVATSATQDFAVVRYNSDGSLDTSFGTTGIVTTAVGATTDVGRSAALQSDGKIVLVGNVSMGNIDFGLVRYNTDGSVDTNFNTTGNVTTDLGSATDYAYGVGIQLDGKIVAGGRRNTAFATARYHSNGSLDTTFNGTGSVFGAFNGNATAVNIQPDGKILVGGYDSTGVIVYAVVRYNTDGSLDTTFNGTGKVTTALGVVGDNANAMALQPDGKIILGGNTTVGAIQHFGVVRYNTDGSLDTTFNGTGTVTTVIGADLSNIYALALQADNKIIAAGRYRVAGVYDFAIVRYNTDGSLDTSFGTGGIYTAHIGPGTCGDFANAVAVLPNGKIVAAGMLDVGGCNRIFAVMRLR